MKIQQFKLSPLAYAPDELSACINKYSDHQSFVSNIIDQSANIIHFNNKFIHTNKKQLIQFHSEPEKVMLNYPYKKLVIAQYHASLSEYKNCQVVKNIIDTDKLIYSRYREITKIFKVGYSPSITKKVNEYYNKGYEETTLILQRLKNKYKLFDFDVITNVSLEECLKRKAECNIIIDECVTGSYHRSSLEGLAMGKMTIAYLNDKVIDIFKSVTKQYYMPIEIIKINELENFLETLIINNRLLYVLEKGYINYEWFKQYWNPKDIINDFISIYGEL